MSFVVLYYLPVKYTNICVHIYRSDVDATERKLAEDKAKQLAEKLGFDNNLNGQVSMVFQH